MNDDRQYPNLPIRLSYLPPFLHNYIYEVDCNTVYSIELFYSILQNQLYLFKREVKLPISSDQSHGGIDEEYLELQTTAFEQPVSYFTIMLYVF